MCAGNVDSQDLQARNVAGLETSSSNSGLQLEEIPISVQSETSSSTSTLTRRAIAANPIEGIVTGLFYVQNNLNITVLGGHFAAAGSNGSTVYNLALINSTNNNQVSGLTNNASSSAAVLALETSGTTLFAGGTIDGGLALYNLATNQQMRSPPALSGGASTVNAIAARPDNTQVFVGGSFDSAGALQCNSLCVYDTQALQWSSVMASQPMKQGGVINQLAWASSTRLIIAGNITVGNNFTTFASYDAAMNAYHSYPGAGSIETIPGPITAFSAADAGYGGFFVAGSSQADGTPFLSRWTPGKGNSDDDPQGSWTTVDHTLQAGSVIDSVQVYSLTSPHASTPLLDDSQALMVTGSLRIPNFGNVSAALFNGTSFEPFALSTRNGAPGALRRTFVQNPGNFFIESHGHLAVGFVVLIGLAIALALIFLIVVGGIVAERIRRRREGYVRAPSYSPPAFEKVGGYGGPSAGQGPGHVGDIPPDQLFGNVARSGAPRV